MSEFTSVIKFKFVSEESIKIWPECSPSLINEIEPGVFSKSISKVSSDCNWLFKENSASNKIELFFFYLTGFISK